MGGDRLHCGPAGVVLALVIQDHPDRSLFNFWGKSAGSAHDSILSRNGASDNPGAVQSIFGAGSRIF